jgi:hypothetical protein
MMIEVKTSQKESFEKGIMFDSFSAWIDTLRLFDAVVSARRRSSSPNLKHRIWPISVRMGNEIRQLKWFGLHILYHEKTRPDNSAWMCWDHTQINTKTLESLIKFELNPYTLKTMEVRRHHRNKVPTAEPGSFNF